MSRQAAPSHVCSAMSCFVILVMYCLSLYSCYAVISLLLVYPCCVSFWHFSIAAAALCFVGDRPS